MAVSTAMTIGRCGAVIGNLLFPVLFGLSCLGPFVMIGSACLCEYKNEFIRKKSNSRKKRKIGLNTFINLYSKICF